MSGSWPPELRSARAWIVAQSSRGRPISSPTTALGRCAPTSCTNSTSTPAGEATRAWIGSRMPAVMARMRSSMTADHPGLELRRDRLAVGGMAGRVHGQQHVPHALQARRFEVLDHHPALRGREQLGMASHMDHVGVAQHRPVAGLMRHVLPAHGPLAAQPREGLVGRAVHVDVRRVDVGDGVGHGFRGRERPTGRGVSRPQDRMVAMAEPRISGWNSPLTR